MNETPGPPPAPTPGVKGIGRPSEPRRTHTTRPYVVLQEFELHELLASLLPGLSLEDQMGSGLYERIEEFTEKHGQVYVKVLTTEPVKNAPAALRKGGHHMLRPADIADNADGVVVPGVAVPLSSWSEDDVRLRSRLDVEVG